jgi:hypothetical protein
MAGIISSRTPPGGSGRGLAGQCVPGFHTTRPADGRPGCTVVHRPGRQRVERHERTRGLQRRVRRPCRKTTCTAAAARSSPASPGSSMATGTSWRPRRLTASAAAPERRPFVLTRPVTGPSGSRQRGRGQLRRGRPRGLDLNGAQSGPVRAAFRTGHQRVQQEQTGRRAAKLFYARVQVRRHAAQAHGQGEHRQRPWALGRRSRRRSSARRVTGCCPITTRCSRKMPGLPWPSRCSWPTPDPQQIGRAFLPATMSRGRKTSWRAPGAGAPGNLGVSTCHRASPDPDLPDLKLRGGASSRSPSDRVRRTDIGAAHAGRLSDEQGRATGSATKTPATATPTGTRSTRPGTRLSAGRHGS